MIKGDTFQISKTFEDTDQLAKSDNFQNIRLTQLVCPEKTTKRGHLT